MMRRAALLLAGLSMGLALVPAAAVAQPADPAAGDTARGARPAFSPGAPGIGDPYYPLDGNGGYDVRHYGLDLSYDPATDTLSGAATIEARATQDLSSFNLDFEGLTVRSITVDGRRATWSRSGGELTVTPRRGVRDRTRFTTVVTYDGVPQTLPDGSGFLHTDDGALVIGQPDVAATWFPANDHPLDKASFRFRITAPADLQVLANGVLTGSEARGDRTTWRWRAREPMAPYLAMMAIGHFDVTAYREDGIAFWDAIDPQLFAPVAEPRTGAQFAYSQQGNSTYKRLARTIEVPAEGATVTFWVDRQTEPAWDFVFVEAHRPGVDDWTTLPAGAPTTQDTGSACPEWLELHPFLAHYQTATGDDEQPCAPTGTTGAWWAASGTSDGYEPWVVDLGVYAGGAVELSLSYASDQSVQEAGVVVDDVTVSTGAGSTSFEADADPLDGWFVAGPPPGTEPAEDDWTTATEADLPPTVGEVAQGSLAREPEVIDFLESFFGRYPFSASGGIVDAAPINFALENQTRPIYAPAFFDDPVNGDSVVVHELAHQWFGDDLAVEAWQHIWLNEGFATYAEWLWSEREALGTVQENFDFWYGLFPADHPFWQVVIGDPGPDGIFDFAVYQRGAMTLHQLRLAVGDDDFFRILRSWAREQAGGNVTTDEFIAHAERVSGEQLDALFDTWLFTPGRPELPAAAVAAAGARSTGAPPLASQSQLKRFVAGD